MNDFTRQHWHWKASGLPDCELWLIDLDAADWSPQVACSLDDAEHARAHRFHFEQDRRRFIHSHAALRHVLSRHTGNRPQDISIVIDASGKPRLPEQHGPLFNLSHSGAWALIAIHPHDPIGIDLELPRQHQHLADLIDQTLNHHERSHVLAHTHARAPEAFTRLWVRKEACLKATGLGLQVPLQNVDVAPHPPEASTGLTVVRQGTSWWQVAWSDESLPIECNGMASLAWLTKSTDQSNKPCHSACEMGLTGKLN